MSRLPEPGEEARAHARRVLAHLAERIAAAGGALPFDRYLEEVLYAPGLGYYSAGSRKLGAAGDFVTAPELSPLFARCLARPCAEVLARLGGGDLLELGPGSGVLAAGLLEALAGLDALPRRYLLLERSAELRERQQALLGERLPGALAARVEWLEALPEPGFRGVMLANEVLDAIPAQRFRKGAGGTVQEAAVGLEDGRLVWRWVAAPAPLRAEVAAIEADLGRALEPGYCSELAPARSAWVRALGERLERGLLLLVDYGYPRAEYYHPERRDGTLMCHYRHRAHPDPLRFPGLQDISVHVDFTAVALAGREAGLDLAGYTTQAELLLACGLLDLLGEAEPGSAAFYDLTRQVKLLTFPGQMGDLIKAIALARGLDAGLTGFAGRDLRHTL